MNFSVSWPLPPLITCWPKLKLPSDLTMPAPSLNTKRSLPDPPSRAFVPARLTMSASLPSPPASVLVPVELVSRTSAPLPPSSVGLREPARLRAGPRRACAATFPAPAKDGVGAGAAEDRVVVVERGIGGINRRSENEVVAVPGVNDALRTVKELSAVRCQHGVRKG